MDISGWEERFGFRINRQKTEIVTEGHRSVLGFEIGDYGGVTVSTPVTDGIADSLADLLSATDLPLQSYVDLVKLEAGKLKTKLAFYQIPTT
jgi:hypothetical protein